MPVDSRVQSGPGVGHGQTVVRVGHRAQALLQFVALAALRSGPPDRLRGPADAASNAAAVKASAAYDSSCSDAAADANAADASAAATDSSSAASAEPAASAVRRRSEREMAR